MIRPRVSKAVVVTALTVSSFVFGIAMSPVSARDKCLGTRPTRTATAARDFMHGTTKQDVFLGDRGNDKLHGLGGNDKLCGGAGDDEIIGGPGNDHLRGGTGKDIVLGGPGNDNIRGDGGPDLVYGGPGNDRIGGWTGKDRSFGGPGRDTLFGRGGNDNLYGGAGPDRLDGGAGFDVLNGGPGFDTCSRGEKYISCEKILPANVDVDPFGARNRLAIEAVDLAPGDYIQRGIDLTNSGSASFQSIQLNISAAAGSTLDQDTVNGLQFTAQECSVDWIESGGPPYTYVCPGTVSTVVSERPVVGNNIPLPGLDAITPGEIDHLVFTLRLPSSAGNAFIDQASTIVYEFVVVI